MLLLSWSPALACGGLFCDAGPAVTPVVQNAERIAFLIDEDAGEVEAHIQIDYEGPPDDFAWVIPVSAPPEVFLSTPDLFQSLAFGLAPRVVLQRVVEGRCAGQPRAGASCMRSEFAMMSGEASDTGAPNAVDPGDLVTVVAEGQVGPYDHVVLQASDEAALITWLEEHDYDIPSGMGPLLAPYLTDGGHLVAVRLQKDRDTGQIAPLGLRYRANRASIPIQLTALATAPDLRLEVSIFGSARAVPESYLHVAINEANLDWFGGGQNYYDLVARAADQAGGHAFATDFAGPPVGIQPLWSSSLDADAARMLTVQSPSAFADLLNGMGLPADANAAAALVPFGVGVPEGGPLTVDPASLPVEHLAEIGAALEALVFEPRRRADRLRLSPWVTRLSSSLDATEMTVDPVFALNPDLPEVSGVFSATLVTDCGNGRELTEAPRALVLADGRQFKLPAAASVADDGAFWAERASDVEVVRIERTGPRGLPEVIVDFTADLIAEADPRGDGAGCATSPAGAFALSGLLGLGLARRRRR